MELLKNVYFFAQKSAINAGNNKFKDIINAPRMPISMKLPVPGVHDYV